MRISRLRCCAALTALLFVAACGKKVDHDAPLAFVPTDTPYVFANIDPLPEATTVRWHRQMQAAWPAMLDVLDHALAELEKNSTGEEPPAAERASSVQAARVLKAVLDEVRTRDTPEKWRELGFRPDARAAFYGVGLLPVLRIELADADAFRATLARIEQKSGSKLATARIGEQEVWTLGTPEFQALMAIETNHLVLTSLPGNAEEALKRRVLGLDRPAQNLGKSGALADFNKQRGYLSYGSGWMDTRRIVALLGDDPGVAAFARAGGIDPPSIDAICRSEFDALAAKMPRLAFGYTAFDTHRMTLHARLDLAADLAKSLVAIGGTPPGVPSRDALLDVAIALPILRARDFWMAQADAVIAAPFKCAALAPLSASFAEMKAKFEPMIPPPIADLSGVRVSVRRFAWPEDAAMPDVDASVLIGSSNPAFLLNLARIGVPALQDITLAADGKPVALPASALPGGLADVTASAAMTATALAVAVGKDEVARLGALVSSPPANPGVLLQMSMSGQIYLLFGDAIARFANLMPPEQRAQLESQRKLYAMYAQWFKRIDAQVALGEQGIDFTETIEFADP